MKRITPERAMEAAAICLESITDGAIFYQSAPACLKVTCVAIVSSIDFRALDAAGFYAMISTSHDIIDWGLELRIYEATDK